jgi:hypothetical protein
MKYWLLAAGIAFSQASEPTLDEQFARIQPAGTVHALLTIIAEFEDGSPARGVIQCNGTWYKHQEDDQPLLPQLPFKTDSRGAVIMNPRRETGWIICWSERDGKSGQVTIDFADEPRQVVKIVLR